MIEINYIQSNTNEFKILYSKYARFLPPSAIDKIEKYVFDKDKLNYLNGRLLVLEKFLKINPEYNMLADIQLSEFGKPFLKNHDLDFNISHSGHYTVCAFLQGGAIGIDIQECKQSVDIESYRTVFSETEINDILSSSNPKITFYKYWAYKEALLKAKGTGFGASPSEVCLPYEDLYFCENNFNTAEIKINENYVCVVASQRKIDTISLRKIDLQDTSLLINRF